jgi:hypothetical protein
MNKEQQELLDEVYGRYWNSIETSEYDGFGPTSIKFPTLMKEQFVERIKTDDKFSEKWGLKIEERDLSLRERSFIVGSNHNEVSQNIKAFVGVDEDHTLHKHLDEINTPTKLITITYNDKTIESYE